MAFGLSRKRKNCVADVREAIYFVSQEVGSEGKKKKEERSSVSSFNCRAQAKLFTPTVLACRTGSANENENGTNTSSVCALNLSERVRVCTCAMCVM